MIYHLRRLIYAFLLMFLSIVIGISGYMIIEGYGMIDALYMAIKVFDEAPVSPFERCQGDPHIWESSSGIELMLQLDCLLSCC